jgi:hypothetical protein
MIIRALSCTCLMAALAAAPTSTPTSTPSTKEIETVIFEKKLDADHKIVVTRSKLDPAKLPKELIELRDQQGRAMHFEKPSGADRYTYYLSSGGVKSELWSIDHPKYDELKLNLPDKRGDRVFDVQLQNDRLTLLEKTEAVTSIWLLEINKQGGRSHLLGVERLQGDSETGIVISEGSIRGQWSDGTLVVDLVNSALSSGPTTDSYAIHWKDEKVNSEKLPRRKT